MLLYNSRARCRRCCLWPFCFLDLEHYSDPVLGLWMGLDVHSLLRLGIECFLLLI